MKTELRATEFLRLAGGECRNRCHFADWHYETRNGHRSRQYAYAAVKRAIKAGQIALHADGRICVTQ